MGVVLQQTFKECNNWVWTKLPDNKDGEEQAKEEDTKFPEEKIVRGERNVWFEILIYSISEVKFRDIFIFLISSYCCL